MESPSQILDFLDRSFGSFEMPCFGNMNIDYISSRLLAFRDDTRWVILFNSIVWWASCEGLTTLVTPIGICLNGKLGFDNDRFRDGYFTTGNIQYNEFLELFEISVRDRPISLSELNIIPHPHLHSEYKLDIAIALVDKYREELLASEDEYRRLIPDGLTEVLRLDEWHHPDWDCPPSQTETFPLIAEVLFTGNSNLYKPPRNPNTDWQFWLPK
jgi:hypothetical protein